MNGANQSNPTVLVIDDMVENTRLLSRFLQPQGYSVTGASCGEDALEIVARTPPDVILLDLVMPGMDGFEVCSRLKHDPTTRHIPVIIITGLSEKAANVRAIEAGADDFLVKPFDAVLLNARLKASLETKRLQDSVRMYQRELEDTNQNLERRVRERTEQIARTQQVAVFSLSKLAESRDTETGAHLERMRCYSREIARELATWNKYSDVMPPSLPDEIFKSSPLHDIGKVGIPDRILLKPGKLTPEEFDIMKTHTTIGGETLRAADEEAGGNSFLAMGRDIAFHHHEKWDGSGYPFGLSGEDIPLVARIVALGDVYDALSSKRPYKEPFSHEKSRGIILEGRGVHFDPDVVDAFVKCEEAFLRIRNGFQDSGMLSPIQKLTNALEKSAVERPDAVGE